LTGFFTNFSPVNRRNREICLLESVKTVFRGFFFILFWIVSLDFFLAALLLL